MLLRSSSTPILSSLLSSNDSANNSNNSHHHHHNHLEKSSSLPSSSFAHSPRSSVSRHLCPLSDSSPGRDSLAAGFRRVRSDGNLHSLLSPGPRSTPTLDSIPSFSVYSSRDPNGGEEEYDDGGDRFEEKGEGAIGRGISGGFSFVGRDQNLNLAEKSRDDSGPAVAGAAFPLFLARGLGIDRLGSGLLNAGDAGGGCGGGGGSGVTNGNGGGRSDIENYYRRMVEENPSNALFLSNYAQFLYQNKGDAQRAEEYYSRAILADPGDGEILSRYAKLVWELHRDEERASSYYEQAVRAAPNNSHILGAYASFLWETEDDDGEGAEEDFGAQILHEVLA